MRASKLIYQEYSRLYYLAFPEIRRAVAKKYEKSPKGRAKIRLRQRGYYAANPKKAREKAAFFRAQARKTCLHTYGGTPAKCQCKCGCQEAREKLLEIHHINGDGASHRRKIGGSGALTWWLIKNKFPASFTILCPTCHIAHTRIGVCVGVTISEKNHPP